MLVHSTIIYEPNVYDCSDMSMDQHDFFESIGIKTDYAISHSNNHMWLVLDLHGHDIHWESTMICPIPEHEYDCRMDDIQ